jgi:hypothetical protein
MPDAALLAPDAAAANPLLSTDARIFAVRVLARRSSCADAAFVSACALIVTDRRVVASLSSAAFALASSRLTPTFTSRSRSFAFSFSANPDASGTTSTETEPMESLTLAPPPVG